MTRFKTEQEWRDFCDTSPFCLCGQLMSGLHMMHCSKVREQDKRWSTEQGGLRITESGERV